MKKVLKTMLFCLIIISLSACGLEDLNVDIKTSSVKELIGTWTTEKKSYNNNEIIESRKYQFNEDGTCLFARVYTVKGVTLNKKEEGSCFLNVSKDKIRLQKGSSSPGNWESFKMEGDTITIGSYTYTKSVE